MSKNRENVIWQSATGTWNRGFYAYEYINDDSEDFDDEWDVEYLNHFNWVATGLASEAAAEAAWRGCNPGGWVVVHHSPETAKECAALDALAQKFTAEQAEQRRRDREAMASVPRYWR